MTYQGIMIFRNSHGEIPRPAYFPPASKYLFDSYTGGGEIPFPEGGRVLESRWLEEEIGWKAIYEIGKEMIARYPKLIT